MFNFEKLEVYQEAINFASGIYELTKKFPRDEIYGITNQIRRAAVSISLNIAEGSARSKKEFGRFLSITKGSIYECVPLLQISLKQGYVSKDSYADYYEWCTKLSKMISGLIKSMNQ